MKTVGTVFPFTAVASRKMIQTVDFNHGKNFVELGGGNGAVTRELLKKMRPDARLIVFELDPKYAASLRQIIDRRLTVIQDSAEHLEKYLKQEGMEQVDAVLSTLPLVIFEKRLRNRIMDEVMRVLKPGGCYIQMQFSVMTKKEMKARFKNMRITFTPFNMPPAFFYIVTKE